MARKIELDYDKINYLARRLVNQRTIASKVGFSSESAFSRRKKRDPQLKMALEGGYDDARIGLEVALYRQSIEHHYTMCGDCHRIADQEFFESCPFCDLEEAREEGYNSVNEYKAANPGWISKHTNVRHKIQKGDSQILLHMAKHHLGQTDKSLIEIHGSKTHPLMFSNMTKEQVDRKLKAILPFLVEEYYPSKEKPLVVEIVPPDA